MSTSRLHQGAVAATMLWGAIERYPDREAIVHGERRFTYRDYGDAISLVVQMLKARGLQRGDGIAVLSKNRPEPLFVLGAAHAMGLRYVPLHPFGSREDHSVILNDADVAALLFDGVAYEGHVRSLLEDIPTPRNLISFDPVDFCSLLGDECGRFSPMPVAIEAQGDDIVQILYTGGTSGRPKGVIWSQRMLVNQTTQFLAQFEWPERIRFLAAAPVSHALLGMLPPTHARGGALVLNNGFDPVQFMETVEKERATAAFLVPTMIYALLDHPRVEEFDLSSLQTIVYAGSPINPARLSQALERFGTVFCQLYGQSESCGLTYLSKGDHAAGFVHRLASCGRPLIGVDIQLQNEDGDEVATGEIGEICVRGPNVMAGYWKLPDETKHALRDGWLHTADMARRDADGLYYLVDRAKDMIISGGFNVYPREIEEVLEQHEAVSLSAVIGVPHEKWGEAVTAFVVLREGRTVEASSLIAMVRDKKGRVHAPKTIAFVADLPKTSMGKIDKKALRSPYWGDAARQIS